MCGIFGFVLPTGSAVNAEQLKSAIAHLFRLSEPRGQEAGGLVFASTGHADVFKRALKPTVMMRSAAYKEFIARQMDALPLQAGKLTAPLAVIGHCRLVTNGVEIVPENNQPIITDATVGIHNGIVTNEAVLRRKFSQIPMTLDSDSEVIFRLIDHYMATNDNDLMASVRSVFDLIEGAASIACVHNARDALALATNTGSLHMAQTDGDGPMAFASERYILQRFVDVDPIFKSVATELHQVPVGEGRLVRFEDADVTAFDLQETPVTAFEIASSTRRIKVYDDNRAIDHLQRCTKCILPVTYPHIEFDADGVCNYCRDYEKPKLAGKAALEAELAKHRRTDGQPDCIVAFSGGRDSSYGLHLLKTEYDMNPVAYSYDWGMVTDIARRNQARMTGQLGVEHFFRAADIPAKRRYIRKNIMAWLKRPHLGMVPIFMAGDKFFYRIGRQLRHETGIPLVIFCAGNPLERTDFKGGFAGIRESMHGQRLFAFSLANKLQIAAFYGSQYLLNPAYFNESFRDTVESFFTTFVGKDDFLYLFHYLEWDEKEINKTLIEQYGWETAPNTDNTWRIGDGYTSFINYIYHSIAGFSEFDTFRSQEIRAGLMTRDEALALAFTDNQPDIETLQEFAGQIGINLEEVITRIEGTPKLY